MQEVRDTGRGRRAGQHHAADRWLTRHGAAEHLGGDSDRKLHRGPRGGVGVRPESSTGSPSPSPSARHSCSLRRWSAPSSSPVEGPRYQRPEPNSPSIRSPRDGVDYAWAIGPPAAPHIGQPSPLTRDRRTRRVTSVVIVSPWARDCGPVEGGGGPTAGARFVEQPCLSAPG